MLGLLPGGNTRGGKRGQGREHHEETETERERGGRGARETVNSGWMCWLVDIFRNSQRSWIRKKKDERQSQVWATAHILDMLSLGKRALVRSIAISALFYSADFNRFNLVSLAHLETAWQFLYLPFWILALLSFSPCPSFSANHYPTYNVLASATRESVCVCVCVSVCVHEYTLVRVCVCVCV